MQLDVRDGPCACAVHGPWEGAKLSFTSRRASGQPRRCSHSGCSVTQMSKTMTGPGRSGATTPRHRLSGRPACLALIARPEARVRLGIMNQEHEPAHALAGPRPGVLLIGVVLALAWLVAAGCGGRKSAVTAELRFEWRAGAGFRGEVSLHEAFPNQPQAETVSYREGERPRMGPEIADHIVRPEVGATVKFLIVVRNPNDEPLRFWVTPHLPLPYSAERGLIMHCLCTGQQYEVPPRGAWTRVIETGLNPEAGTRGPIVITHAFIAGDVPAP